jgi:hypothetical protein
MVCGDLASMAKWDHKLEHEGRTWGKFPSMILLTCNEPSFLKLPFVRGLNDDQTFHSLNKYVHGVTPKINFLFLQKQKLKGDKAR